MKDGTGFVTTFLPSSTLHQQRATFCGTTTATSKKKKKGARIANTPRRVLDIDIDIDIIINTPACTSQPEREVADENDALQRELRAKVKELYGGTENVSIALNGGDDDDGEERALPEFTVTDGEYRQAVFTVSSIAVLSVLAGLVFAFMYNSGAIHGSPEPQKIQNGPRPYQNTNSHSRLDPYAMLGRDLDFGDF